MIMRIKRQGVQGFAIMLETMGAFTAWLNRERKEIRVKQKKDINI